MNHPSQQATKDQADSIWLLCQYGMGEGVKALIMYGWLLSLTVTTLNRTHIRSADAQSQRFYGALANIIQRCGLR